MNKQEITALYKSICTFYREKTPYVVEENIFAPASIEDIEAIETELKERLPEDLSTFLALNNFRISFCHNFDCLSVKGILEQFQFMNNELHKGVFNDGRIEHHKKEDFGNWKSGAIQEVWWSEKWLPISVDSCNNMKCIDFAPAAKGRKHQIISMEVQGGQGPFITDYISFGDYLNCHLYYLKNNKWSMEKDSKGRGIIQVDRYA